MLLSTLSVSIEANATNFISNVAKATAASDTFESKLNASAQRLDRFGSQMTAAGRTLTAAVTLPLLAIGVGSLKAATDFESSFAGVRKTVDATEAEFSKLAQGFRDMAKEIPINVHELNRIGEAAGQLGISKDAILDFTETVAMMSVTTNLSADEAANAFARIANIMGTSQEDYARLGSTVVDLGNNLATTEAEMVEFGLRLAGAGKIAGMTEAQILAIGGAMSSVGVQAEAGGTAVQKVLLDITKQVETGGDKLQKYAETAGMSAQEFAAAWRSDPGEAFTKFVEGLGNAGTEAMAILDELGLKDQRLIRTFLSLAGAGDLLRKSIDMGTKAWAENSAMQDEAAQRFETFASKLQILKSSIYDVAIELGGLLMPYAERFVIWLKEGAVPALMSAVEWFDKLPAPLKTAAFGLAALLALVGPIVLAVGMFAGAVSNLIPLLLTLRAVLMGTNARLFVSLIQSLAVAMQGAAASAGLLSVALKAVLVVAVAAHIKKGVDALRDAKGATDDWVRSLGDGPEALDQITAAIRIQERELEALHRWDWERIWNPGKRYQDIAIARGQLDALTDGLGNFKGSTEQAERATVDFHRNAIASLADHGAGQQAFTNLQASGLLAVEEAQKRAGSATTAQVDRQLELAAATSFAMTVSEQAGAAQEQAAARVFAGLQLQGEALEDFTANVSESYASATSLVAAFGSAAEVTAQQVMKHFADQVEAARNWSANIIALGKAGIDEGLIQQLAEAGPKAAPLVQALLDAVAAGNLEAINQAQRDLASILGDTVAQLNGVTPEAIQAGRDAGGGWAGSLATALHGARSDTGNITGQIVGDLNRVGNTHPRPTVSIQDNASATIRNIQAALNGLQSKTVTITAIRRDTGSIADYHTGGIVTMHSGGLRPDERLAKLQAGEYVLQRSAVQALGIGTLNMLNQVRSRPRARGGDGAALNPTIRGMASAQPVEVTVNVPVHLDGQQIAASTRKQTLRVGRQNGTAYGQYA